MTAPPQPLHAVTTDVNRTESWQWHRVLAVVEQCTARRFVASVFEHRRGAHRVLTTEAFMRTRPHRQTDKSDQMDSNR